MIREVSGVEPGACVRVGELSHFFLRLVSSLQAVLLGRRGQVEKHGTSHD